MPVTPTYDLIASNVLTSSAASVTFSSIPATYRDLVLVADTTRSTSGDAGFSIRLNGDSGANYSYVVMEANGSTALSASATGGSDMTISNTYSLIQNTTRGIAIFHFMDYSATDKHKTMLGRGNNAALAVSAGAGRWANTAAVNSVRVATWDGSSFASGSTFYLYGIVS